MTNIIEILKSIEIEIPEDKLTSFNKAFAENYKTIVEHQKALDRITAEKKRADIAEESLQKFDGIDPADIQKQLKDARQAVEDAKTEAKKQLDARDFSDALRAELDQMKFSSAAARRDFENHARGKLSQIENGRIIGLTDVTNAYKEANPDAFVSEDRKPHFTAPNTQNGGGNTTQSGDLGKLSMAEYIAARKKK